MGRVFPEAGGIFPEKAGRSYGPAGIPADKTQEKTDSALYRSGIASVSYTHLLCEGTDVAIIACGEMVKPALDAAGILKEKGISAGVVDTVSYTHLPPVCHFGENNIDFPRVCMNLSYHRTV